MQLYRTCSMGSSHVPALTGTPSISLIPTAPAILNAIRDACGAEIDRLPALPHRVLAAIRLANGKQER